MSVSFSTYCHSTDAQIPRKLLCAIIDYFLNGDESWHDYTVTGLLEKQSAMIKREAYQEMIRYILPSEYEKVMRYLDGISRTMPGLLKPSPPTDPDAAKSLQEFMDAKGITSTVPVSAMSKADHDKMYGYVLSQGHTPECATPRQENLSDKFFDSLKVDGITEKKKLLLLQLRNQINELAELGIDPFHTEDLEAHMAQFQAEYTVLDSQRAELTREYRTLAELSQAVTYAESPSFLYGSLFNEKVHTAPEVVETEERDKKGKPHSTEIKKDFLINIDPLL